MLGGLFLMVGARFSRKCRGLSLRNAMIFQHRVTAINSNTYVISNFTAGHMRTAAQPRFCCQRNIEIADLREAEPPASGDPTDFPSEPLLEPPRSAAQIPREAVSSSVRPVNHWMPGLVERGIRALVPLSEEEG
jgi:hypothetical protein